MPLDLIDHDGRLAIRLPDGGYADFYTGRRVDAPVDPSSATDEQYAQFYLLWRALVTQPPDADVHEAWSAVIQRPVPLVFDSYDGNADPPTAVYRDVVSAERRAIPVDLVETYGPHVAWLLHGGRPGRPDPDAQLKRAVDLVQKVGDTLYPHLAEAERGIPLETALARCLTRLTGGAQ